jgi:hypothetical protein
LPRSMYFHWLGFLHLTPLFANSAMVSIFRAGLLSVS